MLPKKNRLKNRKDFNKAFKQGETKSNSHLIVKVKRNDFDKKRIGFIAPMKHFKKATDRNRVKRLLREAVRPNLEVICSGYDVIIIAKESIIDLSLEEVKQEIMSVLSKFNILEQ